MRRLTLLLVLISGCATSLDDDLDGFGECGDGLCDVGRTEAFCSVRVRNRGTFDVEETYLPRVLACENPGASPASLRAQAIAARSFLYNVLASEGSIGDGERYQVFTCGRSPTQEMIDAVRATSGQFLRYRDTTVAGFFVAGAIRSGANCDYVRDPTRTEKYVTYNGGKTGNDITQTRLGSRRRSNYANRGAMSQNGANCHANNGWSTEQILEFYYGADIELAQAHGVCVSGPVPEVTDVGQTCTQDSDCQERCEVSVTSAGTVGFCSAACTGGCPGDSECVDLGAGEGRCAPAVSADNNFCYDMPGTEPAVLQNGKSEWVSVCAPEALGTECTIAGTSSPGECVDTNTTSCAGTLYTGLCPGGNNIRCCSAVTL